jgi:Protein ChrB, N-terminal
VFLVYRLPREPSAPRLALWRAVRRLGVLQLGDGLVALPHSARNLEHLQWQAADIIEHDGTATVWHARADSSRDHDAQVTALQAAVEAEYRVVLDEAETAIARGTSASERRRVIRRLRGQLRRIGLRDHFDSAAGGLARAAVDRLARSMEAVPA